MKYIFMYKRFYERYDNDKPSARTHPNNIYFIARYAFRRKMMITISDEAETEKEKKIILIVTIITVVITIVRDPLRALRIGGSRASWRYLIVTNTNNGVIGIACAH